MTSSSHRTLPPAAHTVLRSLRAWRGRPNVLLLGASGGVAHAFLRHVAAYRDLFGALVLVDQRDTVVRDKFIDHELLRYVFVRQRIDVVARRAGYEQLLKKHRISIVIDLTDMNSIEILEVTNALGVSYVNTAMNDEDRTVAELLADIYPRKATLRNAPHILCAGMNPGNVNMWVRYGIERFGVPREIIHFEYDTAHPAERWHPLITWSIHEFLVESVRDPSGIALGKGKVKTLVPNALRHRVSMKRVLEPVMKLPSYPEGFTILHEENLSIANKYNIPSKFLYAIHPATMERLVRLYQEHGNVRRADLRLGDNTTDVLEGSDSIGVLLEYGGKKVYYINSIPNDAVIGTNATYTQVTIGVCAALFTLLFDRLKPGAYFVEDLYDTHYKDFMFDNLRVKEFVFEKRRGRLQLTHFNPMVTLRRRDRVPRYYVL